MYENLQLNLDGSYTFTKRGMPYNCPNVDEWAEEFAVIDSWAKDNPDRVILETPYIKPLEDVKKEKSLEINSKRDVLEASGFEYLGSKFDTDEKSYLRIVGADNLAMKAVQGNVPFNITWTTADNEQKVMNAEEMLGLLPAFALYSDALHQKATQLKLLVEQATTIEEVEAIVWE